MLYFLVENMNLGDQILAHILAVVILFFYGTVHIFGPFSIFVFAGLWFFPVIIGMIRNHPKLTPITLLTIFSSWTVVGWIVALFMALSSSRTRAEKRLEVLSRPRRTKRSSVRRRI